MEITIATTVIGWAIAAYLYWRSKKDMREMASDMKAFMETQRQTREKVKEQGSISAPQYEAITAATGSEAVMESVWIKGRGYQKRWPEDLNPWGNGDPDAEE
jgi:hypothetical protein